MLEHFKKVITKEELEKYTLDERRIICVLGKPNIFKEYLVYALTDKLYLFYDIYKTKIKDILFVDISLAKEIFKFQPNHPKKNNYYIMNTLYPNKYIHETDFNRYNNELKYSSLMNLCRNLGAKKVLIEAISKNGQEIKFEADGPIPINDQELFNANIKIGNKLDKETGLILETEYGEGNKGIKEYDSPWLDTEPTWKDMCNAREKNDLKVHSVSCNYNELITSEMRTGVKKVFNIFGKREKTVKIEIKYRVIFW